MSAKGEKTREAILNAAVKLIDESDGCSELLIRDVAKAAGVSDGSPNYYFGSKDNLINEVVYTMADKWLQWWFEFNKNLELPPDQKIRVIGKNLGNYYAEHPNLVKISLQNDLFMGFKDAVRVRFSQEVILPLTREGAPEKSTAEINTIAYAFMDTFDVTFLRAVSKHPDIDFDFFHKPDRDTFIDRIIDYSILLLKS
jgi:AcrR family transcriptional regulator